MPDSLPPERPSVSGARVSQPYRLARGGVIDRMSDLSATFDGRTLGGFAGDTLASAMLANGVRLVGRSFKYHRPRGILSAGPEEPNALVELGEGALRTPNTRATMVPLADGLVARSQNRFPSLGFDLLAANRVLAPILGAGFYYKTFMWPASFWEPIYEKLIRRAAGLGALSGLPDPGAYETVHAFCDVLVIGAGPAGLAAALAAGASGARVMLCTEDFALGGRLLCEGETLDGLPGSSWAADAEVRLRARAETRVLTRTTVFGVYDGGTYGAVEQVAGGRIRERLWKIVAKRAVLASGAIERPLVFEGNDLPGVMLAGAAQSYVNRFAVRPGKRAVVVADNDDGAAVAGDLTAVGVEVVASVDTRQGGMLARAIGGRELRAVEIVSGGTRRRVDCDLLAMAGGWTPTLHLTTALGAKPVWNAARQVFLADEAALPAGMSVVGAASGAYGLADCLASGARAGAAAAVDCGFADAGEALPAAGGSGGDSGWVPFLGVWGQPGTAFVDFQNDVTAKDVGLAHDEGYRAVEHLKRYTTLGMATDQGKTASVNGMALMAARTGRGLAETGTTRPRPPYTPVSIGALAGRHRGRAFRPTRYTPTHDWAEARGAVFVESGAWLRASYFPAAGERSWQESMEREVRAVREGVGFCDVSTLGKIDVQGADASAFLDYVCANTVSRLAVGRCQYILLLREDGFINDDGTAARLGTSHFVMTASTAHAGAVFQHLEYVRQFLRPDFDVRIASVTEQWAQIAVAGPRARSVVEALADRPELVSRAAFPALSCAELTVCGGVRARLFGLSFSGELAYEVAVPARFGHALAERLAGLGAVPYGLEALSAMRIEKGYPAGGELCGQVSAHDLGLEKLLGRKDFVGKALASRAALTDPSRPRMVGLLPLERGRRLRAGAHLIARGAVEDAAHDEGWVTSATVSPTLGRSIGLGLLARGPERIGEVVMVTDPLRGERYEAKVVSPIFYDPGRERANG